MDNENMRPHGDPSGDEGAENAPTLGYMFTGKNGTKLDLYVYGEGNTRLIKNDEWNWDNGMVQGNANGLATAGAILGRLEWPDCFRHARFTYIKSGDWMYVLIDADGKAGGLNTSNAPISSSAATYTDFPLYMIDIKTGTAYFQKSLKTNAYASHSDPMITSVLSDIDNAAFTMYVGGGKVYAYMTDYGFTYDKDIIASYAAKCVNTLEIEYDNSISFLTVNDDDYTNKLTLALGAPVEVVFELPEGKVVTGITLDGASAAYSLDGSFVKFYVDTYKNYKEHKVVINLKDGKYVEQTTFTGKITIAEEFKNDYQIDNAYIRFTGESGEVVNGTWDKETGTYSAVLKKGIWNLYASNGYLRGDIVNLVSGTAETETVDIALNKYVADDSIATKNGGLVDRGEGVYGIKTNVGGTQESALSGITFTPNNEILEYGFTMRDLTKGDGGGKYPFFGMFVQSSSSNMMRLTWSNAGDQLTLMTSNDYEARTTMTRSGNNGGDGWVPFGSKTGYYTFRDGYVLDVKVRIDGYKVSLTVKTGAVDEWKTITWDAFDNGTEFDVKAWYSEDNNVGMRINPSGRVKSQYKDTLYLLDQPCMFGCSARRDSGAGLNENANFSNIWYNIIQR